ncbi:MAG TPA: DegT/DnrJ/EryC1/StrS family aminotransferase [Coriobacteriia bacterium]|jgi:dTDP-4-amino-4,6-dideoxygalactose transaminase
MSDDFLMFHRPSLGDEEEQAVTEVLRSGWLTTGPRTKEFERVFAAYRGAAHGVGVNSCTAALHVALLAMGVGPGDEVVTTPMTFASTANVIVHTGATPVFCDVQPDTLNMDPDALASAVTERTKAVIPVHFAGHPCDMDEIDAVVRPRGIRVLEDAAHAVESEYRGRPVGSLGDAAAFSFYATKNITTGEGGMLTTGDASLAERAQILALHGISRDAWKRYTDEGYRHYDIVAPGFKYNMFDIQAALGLAQLRKVDGFRESRKRLTERYDEGLHDLPALRLMERRDYVKTAYHLYVVRVTPGSPLSRDELMAALQARGIGVGVHFRAVHLHPYYREAYGFRPGMFPESELAGDSVVSLPLFPSMTDAEVDRVVQALHAIL